jgi:hypothetical protein
MPRGGATPEQRRGRRPRRYPRPFMTGSAVPAPESCRCNLHRIGDQREPRPEPTDLCRNALGVFSMTDCPLTIGLPCAYYDASPAPHPTTGDLDLDAARAELHRDFLGWRYRRRVRWLTKPKNVVPTGIVVEAPPEPEEVVPETLVMRVPSSAPGAPEGGAPAADAAASASAQTSRASNEITGPVAAAPPAAPERYPGQRRSEERLAKKKARLAARAAADAAAKAAQIAAMAANVPAAEDDEDEDDEGFGAGVEGAEPEAVADTGPKTVEEVLAALPDAPVVVHEPRRHGGPRGGGQGGGPPREGGPRRRRRRGRRGGGGGGPRPQGQGPGPGPRPPRQPA